LSLNGQDIELHHGYLESTGSPVGYVSWVAADGTPLVAADIVRELQIELYEVQRQPKQMKRMLALATVALHWWEHASG
jgi:hypothetical protein